MNHYNALSRRQAILVLLGFISILFVLGLAALIGLTNLTRLNQQLEELVTDNNAKAQLITLMRDMVRERMLSVHTMTYLTDPFAVEAEWERYSEYAGRFIHAREQLYALHLTEYEHQLLESQKVILADAQTLLDKVVSLSRLGKAENARLLVLQAQAMNDRVMEELQTIRKTREAEAEKSLQESRFAYRYTLIQMLVLGCIAIILSILIIVFVVKKINHQERILQQALREISVLNELLQADNQRMGTELAITRQLQQMLLPKEQELSEVNGLEIAGFMEPAAEVGGDYYDVLKHNERVICAIGDVTGHGLESSVLMLMVQTAVCTLLNHQENDPVKFLDTLNRTIYHNIQRMNSDKNLTLALVNYQAGKLFLSGQHEEMIVVRAGGTVERIDTMDLGFPIGLEENIARYVAQTQVSLHAGDIVVLYTDGITEAENQVKEQYSVERLCQIISRCWQCSATEIRRAVIDDVRQHIGNHRVFDDITLLVLKKL
ncbi:PP2C family protein-serine/threonine phosphatase [Beggiatoa leptomitoformis]|uniref:SpoIIE family protein phosphatase n=1 Tax=Beggiatoa leptomitoformis TaxID=288004 RepID=A0A2N9YAN6_9GAMM|nr:SpoIIE family protein phosphatase [Beggiatoa leptomitoformis]AUI67537.1 SpoIIE family protein phosphatase [Beggiatoa leptomitoformis]QGX03541.1 SpoIIE family protein phosphatase [Beggiatoa leptomitoformis]